MFPKIKFKPSFFIVAAFSVCMGFGQYFLTLFILVILHEMCHIFTAGIWGLKTKTVTVTPIGTYAEINGINDIHITKRLLIVLAGPIFNLALCPFCKTPLRQINFALALFNLLPLYPLDGGRIFHYIISYFTGVLRGNILAVKLSIILSITLVSAGLVQLILCPPNISLLCLGVYFYRLNKLNTINLTYGFYKTIINKGENKIMPVRSITTSSKMELKAVLYRLGWDYYTLVYVRDNNALYAVSEEKLLSHIMKNGIKGSMLALIHSS